MTADQIVEQLQTIQREVELLGLPEVTVIAGLVTATAQVVADVLDRKQKAWSAQSAVDAMELGIQAEIATGKKAPF